MTLPPLYERDALILIVDDDESRRYTKARTLRRAGYEVIEAGTGREGLELVRERRPRLAIVDVGLPDIDGHEVARRIKADPEAGMPVLQISATFVSEADTVASLESGADASLIEPIEPPVLVATVRALLRARQAEEAMRDALGREQSARAVAEDANRIKDEFLAVLSHELRSPLGAILSWVTLLRSGKLDDQRRERGLAAIERNVLVQTKLVDDLLDVSRIISGKNVLETSLVELGPTVEAATESIRAAAEAKEIHFEVLVDPTVGPLMADPTRLQQVIWNLLSNAVKFTSRGGSVRVNVESRDSMAIVRVTDTGQGISPQFLPHVFERFRQADSSTTRSEGGLGLGLAIVRHIVELHGGHVRAESEGIGKGSSFTVMLPLPAVRMTGGGTVVRERLRTSTVPFERLDGLRILVVDDEDDAREAVAAMLEVCGAVVVARRGVPGAIEALDQQPFDMMISDIGMPEQDGYGLIRRVREREADGAKRLPAIALSAYANAQEVRRILAAGFDSSLAKPMDAKHLVAEVGRVARMTTARTS